MRIAVVGTIVADTIERQDGRIVQSLGGIAHSVSAISALAGRGHEIIPCCRVGADCWETVLAWAEGLAGVLDIGIRRSDEPNPKVFLSYPGASREGERVERLTGGVSPLTTRDLECAAGADAVLVNCITGHDCTPAAMELIGTSTRRVYLDVHSLALGTRRDGTRFYRPPPNGWAWFGRADVVQCNVPEAATICGLDAGSATSEAVLDALIETVELRDDRSREDRSRETACPPATTSGRCRIWLMTLGPRGVAVIRRRQRGWSARRISAPRVDVVDPTGAGDAFGAGFVVGWLRGETPEEAARQAVRSGTAACAWDGVPAARALRRALADRGPDSRQNGELSIS